MMGRTYPNRDDVIRLTLSGREREALLNLDRMPDALLTRIRIAPVKNGKPQFRFNHDELVELCDTLFDELTSRGDRKSRPIFTGLLDRLRKKLDPRALGTGNPFDIRPRHTMNELDERPDGELNGLDRVDPQEVFAFLSETHDFKRDMDRGDVDRFLTWLAEAVEARPGMLWGGLSFAQFSKLIASPWEEKESPVRLNADMAEEELERTPAYVNARAVLDAVQSSRGVKATQAGNLNRKFVREMKDAIVSPWPHDNVELAMSGAVNERDCFLLHIMRIVLELAGVLRLTKSVFSVTRKGQKLLSGQNAGALYALLFRTTFRKLNLAYLDTLPEVSSFQECIAYALYMFSLTGRKWLRPRDLADSVLLPTIRSEIPEILNCDIPTWMIESRLIQPLVLFGLMENHPGEAGGSSPHGIHKVRKSPLFDRFLAFHID